MVWTLSTLKISIVHKITEVCEVIPFKLALPSTRERKAMYSQCTYKYLSLSVSLSIVSWCIRVSLLKDRPLKTDKFQTIIWCRLIQVDFPADKPVCNGPKSRT